MALSLVHNWKDPCMHYVTDEAQQAYEPHSMIKGSVRVVQRRPICDHVFRIVNRDK